MIWPFSKLGRVPALSAPVKTFNVRKATVTIRYVKVAVETYRSGSHAEGRVTWYLAGWGMPFSPFGSSSDEPFITDAKDVVEKWLKKNTERGSFPIDGNKYVPKEHIIDFHVTYEDCFIDADGQYIPAVIK